MVSGLFAPSAQAQITSFAGLQTAINAGGTQTITISANFQVTAQLTVPNGANITLTSDATTRTLTHAGGNYNMFNVASGAKLTLANITLAGANVSNPVALVNVSGELTVNAGATLRDMRGAGAGVGDGIRVNSGGTFTMTGGTISGNIDGVNNDRGTFTMTGGTISGNGGGVFNIGTFTMTGGTISGNGIGYYVDNPFPTLTLGGTAQITGNTSANVNLYDDKYITLSTATPPATGMNVGITKTANNGVFVNSGATAGHIQYFTADQSGSGYTIEYSSNNGGQLIVQPPPPQLNVGAQNGNLVEGTAGTATFQVTKANLADGAITLNNTNSVTGITMDAAYIFGNSATITIRTTAATPQGSHPLTVTVSGTTSPVFYLTVLPNLPDFYAKVAAYGTTAGNHVIDLDDNLTLPVPVSIPAPFTSGATLTIRTDGTHPVATLMRGTTGDLFTVAGGAHLILEDVIIDGDKSGGFPNLPESRLVAVNSGGFLTMNSGAVLRNNHSIWQTVGISQDNASGSGVINKGTFTMNGGTISGNTSGANGGGVANFGTFAMGGGTISGNASGTSSGGGVRNHGTFTMSGGTISGNTGGTSGSGVSNVSTGIFTMSGGEISGNSSGVSTGNTITLGGDAKITGNGTTASNLFLLMATGGITLGTGSPVAAPAAGMNIGVNIDSFHDGIIVTSGATSAHLAYFTSDDITKNIVLEGDQLLLVTPVDISGATVTQSGALTYDGTAQTSAFTVVVNGTTLTPGTHYTVSVTPQTNAGTYTGANAATITGTGRYYGTVSGAFAIGKADPVSGTHYTSDVATARTYDGSAKAVTTGDLGIYTGMGFATITYTGTGGTTYDGSTTAPTNAGTYAVTVTFAEGANFNAVTTPVSLGTMTIGKAAAPAGVPQTLYVLENHSDTYPFNLSTLLPNVSPRTLGNVTYAVASTTNGSGVLATAPSGIITSPLALDVASVATVGATATITVTISSANYNDFTAVITVETVAKADVSANITFNPGSATYTGDELDSAAATISGITAGANPTWTYTYAIPTDGTATGNESLGVGGKPVNAGNYLVTAVYEDGANRGEATQAFAVNKATLDGMPTIVTAIASAGKTLADVPLTGTFTNPHDGSAIAGTLAWVLPPGTVVTQGTAYQWTFTPTDANFSVKNGGVVLWPMAGGMNVAIPVMGPAGLLVLVLMLAGMAARRRV